MLRIQQLKLSLDYDESELRRKVIERLCLPPDSHFSFRILRRSLDARNISELHFVVFLETDLPWKQWYERDADLSRCPEAGEEDDLASLLLSSSPSLAVEFGSPLPSLRPIVCGSGPAGLFAAWTLCRAGRPPLVLERGDALSERCRRVEQFMRDGTLDPESNIQFGEGGAGTFSDGKLNSRIKDKALASVLEIFVENGAPKEILWQAHPHIGSDLLRSVVAEMRRNMEAMGAEFRFRCRVDAIEMEADGGRADIFETETKRGGGDILATEAKRRITAVHAGGARIPCRQLILALGHSARDSFRMLDAASVSMESKAFAVGFRIEHPQILIDRSQYGKHAGHPRLGAAEYRLSAQVKGKDRPDPRGVYSFCMCPGGEVLAAASGIDALAVNGMSYHARAGENANSAFLCQLDARDYGQDLFDGVRFQEQIEAEAYAMGGGGYRVPVQYVRDFLEAAAQRSVISQDEMAAVSRQKGFQLQSSCRRPTVAADLSAVYPAELSAALARGFAQMARSFPLFADGGALLSAAETRSSSPIRILRDARSRQSLGVRGLYPAGEGAGYAGGISSAAVDGIRSALALLDAF